MSLAELPVFAAVGLGVLTSISPCPMASHAAAISVLVRQAGGLRRGAVVGGVFACGRAASYVLVAWIASEGLVRLGPIVRKVQSHAESVLGMVFVIGGLLLAISPWLKLPGRGIDAAAWKRRLDRLGAVPGAFFLGMILAAAFCPVSAGIFFGSVIPLAMATTPSWSVTVPYGLATALPVFALTLAAGCGTAQIARVFHVAHKANPWLHGLSATGMIGAGLWLLCKAWL
jgi:cytochrome c-type biogenesis protein